MNKNFCEDNPRRTPLRPFPCPIIPIGQLGPTGPTGPMSGLEAYGGMYNDEPQIIDIIVAGTEQVSFNNEMPLLNTSVTDNAITVNEAGIYEINWNLIGTASVGILTTFAIRNNGVNIEETVFSSILEASAVSIYSGSVIVTLAAGDVIDMAISALLELSLTLAEGTNATLSVKKIGDI